jgi:hypothetical protein
MRNRGVSDPPIWPAVAFERRPRRVAHAPIPGPEVSADAGPALGRRSVRRSGPCDARQRAGTNHHERMYLTS